MTLAKALVAAQKEMKNPAFDSTNPHFKNKFASLASVREAVLPVLNKHGLAISQFPMAGDGVAGCRNILMHESGEKMEYDCLLPLSKNDPQGAGSAITYARRYSLQAIAGVVAEEDDDANAASEKPKGRTITPVDGALASLEADDQQTARKAASTIVDLWNADQEFAAYEAYYQQGYSNEMMLGIWELLKPHSAIRSKLKAMHKDTKPQKEAA